MITGPAATLTQMSFFATGALFHSVLSLPQITSFKVRMGNLYGDLSGSYYQTPGNYLGLFFMQALVSSAVASVHFHTPNLSQIKASF